MRNVFSPTRMLVAGLAAFSIVILTCDTASAQRFRRGGVGVGVGVGAGPSWYGGPGGYGRGGFYGGGMYGRSYYPGYRAAWNGYGSGVYAGAYPSMGYMGSSYYSYPDNYSGVMPASYSGTGSYIASSGCCDPCSGMVAAMPQPAHDSRTSGYTPQTGLRIVEVEQQSPAQAAGIAAGSVIVDVDGQPVRSFNDLRTHLQNNNNANQAMKITIIDANGQRHVRDITPRDHRFGVSVVETSVTVPNENDTNRDPNRPDAIAPQRLPDRTTPPATTQPDATTPDRSRPDASDRDRTRPDASQPNRARPDATQPDRTSPRPTNPTRPNVDD